MDDGRDGTGRGSGRRAIRRRHDGTIDMDLYVHRTHRLRARWMRVVLRAWRRGLVRWLRSHRVEAELAALDARMLRDIGITRTDVPRIASGAWFRDDSRDRR